MNEKLLETLKELPNNPSVVVHLYKQLLEGNFLSIIEKGIEQDLTFMSFLTYEAKDGMRELPIFTQESFVIKFQNTDSGIKHVCGEMFWQRVLEVIENDDKLVIAVDPGQKHGIRLTAPMILGMLKNYSSNFKTR